MNLGSLTSGCLIFLKRNPISWDVKRGILFLLTGWRRVTGEPRRCPCLVFMPFLFSSLSLPVRVIALIMEWLVVEDHYLEICYLLHNRVPSRFASPFLLQFLRLCHVVCTYLISFLSSEGLFLLLQNVLCLW